MILGHRRAAHLGFAQVVNPYGEIVGLVEEEIGRFAFDVTEIAEPEGIVAEHRPFLLDGVDEQKPDPGGAVGLLRADAERPKRRRRPQSGDEIPPSHSTNKALKV